MFEVGQVSSQVRGLFNFTPMSNAMLGSNNGCGFNIINLPLSLLKPIDQSDAYHTRQQYYVCMGNMEHATTYIVTMYVCYTASIAHRTIDKCTQH